MRIDNNIYMILIGIGMNSGNRLRLIMLWYVDE